MQTGSGPDASGAGLVLRSLRVRLGKRLLSFRTALGEAELARPEPASPGLREHLGALLAAAEILRDGGPAARERRPARERAGEQRTATARPIGNEPRHEVARELHRRERGVERADEALALGRRGRPEEAPKESRGARLDGERCSRFVAQLPEVAIRVADRVGDEVERQRIRELPLRPPEPRGGPSE